jgi:hypothetical protein
MPNDSADWIDALIDEALRTYAEYPAEGDPHAEAGAILEHASQLQRRAIYQSIDSNGPQTSTANRLNSRTEQ